MKTALFLTAAIALLVAGCTTVGDMKGMSSGHIGCLPNEITISDHSETMSTISWIATCKEKPYVCNQDQSGFNQTVTCTERIVSDE